MNFEEQYQAQFQTTAFPLGMSVFANGKVYKVIDYVISSLGEGVVGIDREGNEKELYAFEMVKYKVCGRCAGSGRYSYNQQDGSVCYGCSGIGKNTLAPNGFPQTVKAVCTLDLPKFDYTEGTAAKFEFVGFSKTGGTPLYQATKEKVSTTCLLRYATIENHFSI